MRIIIGNYEIAYDSSKVGSKINCMIHTQYYLFSFQVIK